MAKLFKSLFLLTVIGSGFLTAVSAFAAPDNVAPTPTLEKPTAENLKSLVMSDENLERTDAELKRLEADLLKEMGTSGPISAPRDPEDLNATTEQPKEIKLSPMKAPAAKASPKPTAPAPDRAMMRVKQEEPAVKATPKSQTTPPNVTDKKEAAVNAKTSDQDTEQRIQIAESQVDILSRELETTRLSLRSAERRIDELSSLVKSSYSDEASPGPSGSLVPVQPKNVASENKPKEINFASGSDSWADAWDGDTSADIATVVVSRTPLRVAPSSRDTVLFLIPQYSRMRIEQRRGEWYRVITPSGTHGWIPATTVVFRGGRSNESAVRVKGYKSEYEKVGFRY